MQFGAVCTILTIFCLLSSAQRPVREPWPDAGAVIRTSLERNASNESRLKDYTYAESQETRTLDKSGATVKTERATSEVLNLYGRPYKRRVSQDGRALVGKEKEKADQEFEREVHKREQEFEAERRKQQAEREKARAEGRRYLQEIPKAYSFKIAGEETLDGMPVWVIDAVPRPDFHSTVKRADLLKKMRGRLWIDKQSLQWVRVEAELIDSISFGGFLAKLDRGARMTFLQKRVNDEVWLPSKMTARVEARLLVKHYSLATETTWSNYRKFRVDSRVLAGDEPAPPKQ
jgi:hypothetical protein